MRQVLLAASLGLIVTLFGTPVAIRLLVRRGYGQLIRDDGPTSHHTKRGTPTMGGAVIIFGTLLGYFGAHLITWRDTTVSGLLVLFLMTGLGIVGFLDDYIKVAKQRSLGLRAWAKLTGQMLIAVTFAILALQFPDPQRVHPGVHRDLVHPGHRSGAGRRPVRRLGVRDDRRHLQRREPHRRPGRAGHRHLGDGVRVLRADRDLAVRQRLPRGGRQVLRGPRPAGPRRGGGGGDGGLLRLPVVERVPGQDLHGRHRLARPRRRAGRASPSSAAPSCCWCSSAACSSSSRCR